MFTSVYKTMQGNDTYTVAKLRSRPDKNHANWDRPGPNTLWRSVYKELDRLESCRNDDGGNKEEQQDQEEPQQDQEEPQQDQEEPQQDLQATLPTVTITRGDHITEGGAASFTITASPAPTTPLSVSLTVIPYGYFAVPGTTGAKTVSIPTGGSLTYTVPTVNDSTIEPNGAIRVTLEDSSDYRLSTASSALIYVKDDDILAVRIEPVTTPITEGENAVFRVFSDKPAPRDITVLLNLPYRSSFIASTADRTVVIRAGETSALLTIPTIDDRITEDDGSVRVNVLPMNPPNYYYYAVTLAVATVVVRDNEPRPTAISIVPVNSRISEGGNARFRLTLSRPTYDLRVKIDLIQRGAYLSSTDPITVVIPRGQTSKTFDIPTVNDSVAEETGSVTAKVWAMRGRYDAGDPMMATVTVQDDDNLKVHVLPGPQVREGQTSTFAFTATPPPFSPITVTYRVVESGSGNRVSSADEGSGKTITIPTTGSVDADIPTSAPAGIQGTGTITVTITGVSGSGYRAGTPTGSVQVSDQVDYDVDNDGLIDINNLAQLDAIRHDTDGDGVVDTYLPSSTWHPPAKMWTHRERILTYAQAFPFAADKMGCPSTGCHGFELKRNLDFDTNGDGRVDQVGDDYWNGGKGWIPIAGIVLRNYYQEECAVIPVLYPGSAYGSTCGSENLPRWPFAFRGTFEGNGYTIANLFVNDTALYGSGLFGFSEPSSRIRNFGLTVTAGSGSIVRGHHQVGALGGLMFGHFSGVYSHVDVQGKNRLGGLIGVGTGPNGKIIESYATGNVRGTAGYGSWEVGGLVGLFNSGRGGSLAASFATGNVTSHTGESGGLVGDSYAPTNVALYATGSVNGTREAGFTNFTESGGLIGEITYAGSGRPLAASYSTGKVGANDGRSGRYGGLLARCNPGRQDLQGVYWDTVTSAINTSACSTGYTTTQLQAPTDYDTTQTINGVEVAIYSNWNVDVDGDGTNDDPWDFGTSSQYPILKYCADKPGIDNVDRDGDGTLEPAGDDRYCPFLAANQHGRRATP